VALAMAYIFYPVQKNKPIDMATKKAKPGPKDREFVNKSEKYEVAYEPKRKTPAKKFGGKKK
jgi:hypothetical protein